MRVQERLILIDLDSSASFRDGDGAGAQRSVGALKFSSGYVAPEMVYHDPDTGVVCVRSPSDPCFAALRRAAEADPSRDPGSGPGLVDAAPSQDLWSLGVVFYQLAVNAPLLLCDVDGNCDDGGLRDLAGWSEAHRLERLRRIGDPHARDLVSQLLSPDPARRPPIARVLAHPFLTGKAAARLVFDVFPSHVAESLMAGRKVVPLASGAASRRWPDTRRVGGMDGWVDGRKESVRDWRGGRE
jgi:serine/threonine protein kinase